MKVHLTAFLLLLAASNAHAAIYGAIAGGWIADDSDPAPAAELQSESKQVQPPEIRVLEELEDEALTEEREDSGQ